MLSSEIFLFHVINVKTLVLDNVIVIENLIQTELNHNQDMKDFMNNEETLDVLSTLLSEKIALVLFLDSTPEIDNDLKFIIVHFDLHQNHGLDLRLLLNNLSKIYKETNLKIMTTTLKAFQSQSTSLMLTCISLKC